ncbi:hypothetical protein CEXT_542061, partial [Caerostris extrusa]
MVFQSAVRTHSGGGELRRGLNAGASQIARKLQSLMTDRRYNLPEKG